MARLRVSRPVDVQLDKSYVRDGLHGAEPLGSGVEHWAEATSDAVAVIDDEETWSYRELARAIGLALGRLRVVGVGPDDTVAMIAPMTARAVAAYHALLRIGAVVIVLDRRCGQSEIALALELGAKRVVAAAEQVGQHEIDRALLIPLEDLARPSGREDEPWAEPSARAPAVVVLTSGTSERPKAVVHSLNSIHAGAGNIASAVDFTHRDRALLATPLANITGICQLHLTTERGGALVMTEHLVGHTSLEHVITNGVTVINAVPAVCEVLLNTAARLQVESLPVKTMSLGGDKIAPELLELAVDRWGILPLRMYGSSEIPVATFTRLIDEGDARLRDDGALGPGTEIVTDPTRDGELLLRGPSLCLGYAHSADNATAFTSDGWFRTGDVGLVLENRLQITGRLKEIAIRKGVKISLAEVDELARSIPGAREAMSFAVPDPVTGERLALAVYVDDPDTISFTAVTEALLGRGASKVKLPEEVVLWDHPMPRNSSGKLVRRDVARAPGRRRLLASRLTGPNDHDTLVARDVENLH